MPQKQPGYSAWTAAGPYRTSKVHTGTRVADGVTVEEGVPVLDREALRVRVDVRVPVVDFVEVFVAAGDDVNERETVDDGDCEPLAEDEPDALDEPLGDPDADDEADDVGEPPPPKPRPVRSSPKGTKSGKSTSRVAAAGGTGVTIAGAGEVRGGSSCKPLSETVSGSDDAPSARRRRRGSARGGLKREGGGLSGGDGIWSHSSRLAL